MAYSMKNQTSALPNSLVCQVNSFVEIESNNSVAEEITWILACVFATIFNSITVMRIVQKRPLQLFDICLINFTAVYLLQGNVLFISMALFSIHGENCIFVSVVVVSFLMLSFTKLAILLVINANQLHSLRQIRIINPQHAQTNKTGRKFLYMSFAWVFSAALVAISVLSSLELFPVFVIAILGKLTLILRVAVMVYLRKIGEQASDTMLQTLAMIKKSIRMVSLFIIIEICSWAPSVVAGLVYVFGPKTGQNLYIVNWCLRILFLTPMFYPFVRVSNISSCKEAVTECCPCCRENNTEPLQVE